MAELIDFDELPGSDPEVVEEPVNTPAPEPKVEVPELPEKYKGKSLDDIVKMHQEAERLIGKQAQEVGEVRKLADELLKQQLSNNKQAPTEEETEIDFFADPKAAVAKAVEKHPDVLEAKRAAAEMKQQQASKALHDKHPDMKDIVSDPEFANWVKASKVRTNLFLAADTQYDTDAADELLSTYKELKAVRNAQAKKDSDELRQATLKAASVDVSGTGESSKKVYRRADLIRLRMTDPARYEALQPEIMSAYADGRVK
jgi:hypothetical protein